ncbi:unnamed protein product [Lupinus luteus]|uniref:Uncharacterized protein n=1 Tax=Lupinus luteus TaxID=3873 RepID=A0AAV1VRU6_LUPLU
MKLKTVFLIEKVQKSCVEHLNPGDETVAEEKLMMEEDDGRAVVVDVDVVVVVVVIAVDADVAVVVDVEIRRGGESIE